MSPSCTSITFCFCHPLTAGDYNEGLRQKKKNLLSICKALAKAKTEAQIILSEEEKEQIEHWRKDRQLSGIEEETNETNRERRAREKREQERG